MRFSQRRRIRPAALSLGAAALLFTALTLLLAACGGSSSSTTSSTGSTAGAGSTTTSAVSGTTTSTVGGTTATTVSGPTTSTAGGGGGSTVQVKMVNRSYDPATVTVKVGDTVTWTNNDPVQHDVVAENGEFKSKLFGKGETFSFTFTTAGTFPYYCSVHPGMAGTVTAQ